MVDYTLEDQSKSMKTHPSFAKQSSATVNSGVHGSSGIRMSYLDEISFEVYWEMQGSVNLISIQFRSTHESTTVTKSFSCNDKQSHIYQLDV